MINKNIFWVSDTHHDHNNIIKFSNRPFKDVEEMNEELIRAWNSVIGEDDEVYHLGDVSLGRPNRALNFLNRLNGKIYLITGNHEKSVLKNESTRNRFEWIKPYHEMYVDVPFESNHVYGDTTGKQTQFIVMCHYAMRVWNKSHHGAIMLYGHSHDSLDGPQKEWGKSMDVGVDSAYRILGEYRPFSLMEIMKIMNKRDIHEIDHHINNKL